MLLGAGVPAIGQASPPPALSSPCKAPASEIAAPEPLPNVSALLAEGKPLRILAIGSAAISDQRVPGEGRYQLKLISILQKALGGTKVEIINRGVSGEVAASAAERMQLLAAMTRPNLVLWQVGTNDALARVDPADFEETVRGAVRWLREHQIDVVLVGLQYSSHLARDPAYIAIREAVARVSKEEHVLHIRRFNAMQLIAKAQQAEVQGGEQADVLADSNSCMAEHIATAVIANLYLRKKPPPSRPHE